MQSGDIERRFQSLRREMLAFIERQIRDEPGTVSALSRVARELAAIRLPAHVSEPLRLPGCRHLAAALDMARSGPMACLAEVLAAIEPSLRWIQTEHYRESLGDEHMDNYCYTNILGLDALIPHDRVVATFFIVGPGRHYPRHHHEAEEVCFPFGGDTLRGQNDEEPHPRSAGKPVHNTPWLPHEMITRTTVLFTFCIWVSPGRSGSRN